MMSTEPVKMSMRGETQRRFMQTRRKSFVDLSTNSHKRASLYSTPAPERINTSVLNRRRISYLETLSRTNSDFYPNNCCERINILMKKNSARSDVDSQIEGSGIGQADGAELKANGPETTRAGMLRTDPDFKADIVSKLRAKAIGDLLFKVKEDLNVKKLNEMKTRPEAVAEKALLMCDLKSYKDFVDDLFASGVIPIYRESTANVESNKSLDTNSRTFAAKRDLENLERMIERVFGEDFHDRNRHQASFFK